MDETGDAGHSVEQARARVTTVADELFRRASAEYVKERARAMARERAVRVRGRAAGSAWMWTLSRGRLHRGRGAAGSRPRVAQPVHALTRL